MLQIIFVYTSVVSYLAFILTVCVRHLSIFWSLGKAVLRDCDIFQVFSLIFLYCHV